MPATVPANAAVNPDSGEMTVSRHAAIVLKMDKETPSSETEIVALRARLRDERRSHAIQKANAEQARRVTDCLRGFYDALLPLLAQPCLTLDRDGQVMFWNDALANWTGIAPAGAIGKTLTTLFPTDAADALDAAFLVARYAAESASSVATEPISGIFTHAGWHSPATFTLLPLCRVPGCLELCLVLFQPFA